MKSLLQKVGTMFSTEKPSPAISPSFSGETITVHPPLLTSPHVLDVSYGMGFLAGQMLVATPVIDGGCFQKSVVIIFSHGRDGAMGLIVNHPIEVINYAALVQGMPLPANVNAKHMPVYFGGPLERHRGFIIHTADYQRDTAMFRTPDLAITASNTILRDLVAGCGPKKAALAVGYAGWGAGQLEAEIEQNSWITVPASADLVLNTENELKWATASKSLGFDMACFSTKAGHA